MIKNIENYHLQQGDCLEVMRDIEDGTVDLILCDLPYNVTACKWDKLIDLEELWNQYNRIIKQNGAIVLFSAQPFTTKLIYSNIKNYKYSWYWVKNKTTGFGFAKYQPLRKVEDINVFYKKTPLYIPQGLKKLDKPLKKTRKYREEKEIYGYGLCKEHFVEYTNYPNNVLYFDKEVKGIHPCQKPLNLLQYLINTYTREGELVLDNCFGSGRTGVACATTNRRFIGIEKDEKIFKTGSELIIRAYNNNR
ncbi:TPA: site-specific DNA-methyltransferase [Clostridioides difficile]